MVERRSANELHTWVEARLSDYLDDRLASPERTALETHLRDCAQCQASLASLRWTVALVKQMPSPALPRSFTLPIVAERASAPTSTPIFGLVRFASALATLLLFVVIGVDVIFSLDRGTVSAPAMAPLAAQDSARAPAPTMAAFAPTTAFAAPTTAPKKAAESIPATQAPAPTTAPTAISQPTSAPAAAVAATATPALAPKPTSAPKPAAPPAPAGVLPTATISNGLGGGPIQPSVESTNDTTAKAGSATPAPRMMTGATITLTQSSPTPVLPTATLLPTATASPIPPTATLAPTVVAQVVVQPTRSPDPVRVAQTIVTPVRVVEIGLLFAVAFFATLTILLWRRK